MWNQKRTAKSIAIALAAVFVAALPSAAQSSTKATMFKLDNGLDVVVIPDHRLPVATHMVFYRVGGADDPAGKSGLAHFLEHLMFKATARIASGEFSRIITRLGGADNAVTTADTTYYHQRVAKDRLKQVMQLEADRMLGLKFDDGEIDVERKVVAEERRSSVEAEPLTVLTEQMLAALYTHHPYKTPVIGWPHELATVTRQDAEAFYRRHYAPNNAVVVVAGDITEAEVRALANDVYGPLQAAPSLPARARLQEPPPRAARHVTIIDERSATPTLARFYRAPSHLKATGNEAEAAELLARILGQGASSRLSDILVTKKKIAIAAGATYSASGRDDGRLTLFAIPAPSISIAALEVEVDAVIADLIRTGPTAGELDLARDVLAANRIFEADSQFQRALKLGEALAQGSTLTRIEAAGDRMKTVVDADIQSMARRVLDHTGSVTGVLLPDRKPNSTSSSKP